jgi:dTDP-glucose pyrophosphorylase
VTLARDLKSSPRGELKITDLHRSYLERGDLSAEMKGRCYAELDTSTHGSLLDAALYVQITKERQGLNICRPKEIAWQGSSTTAVSAEPKDGKQLRVLAQAPRCGRVLDPTRSDLRG